MAVRRTDSVISFVAIISVWELTVRFFHVSPFKFPGPGEVGLALYEMGASGELFDHMVASLYRVTWGYYLAVAAAVPFGLLLGSWSGARKVFNPLIQFLRPISPLAWIPVALIWFGIGDRPAIFLIFLSSNGVTNGVTNGVKSAFDFYEFMKQLFKYLPECLWMTMAIRKN